MSRKGGEICQVDLFIKPSPASCTLECSFPQYMPKHDHPPLQVLSMVCFSFQLLCPTNFTLFIVCVRMVAKVISCLLGNGLTHAERCLCDPAGSVPQQCSLARFLSHLHPRALAPVATKKADRKPAHTALAKHTDLKGDVFWEDKVSRDYLGKN